MRVYWPWWLSPIALAFWAAGALLRLAAYPFKAHALQDPAERERTTIRIVIQDAEKAARPTVR
jgi:hypothetical protein